MRILVRQPAPVPPARDMARVAVVLPAYNEERHIAEAVHRSLAAGAGLVVGVDDCSGDSTGAILERLAADPRVLACRHAVNGGKQAAVKTGLRAALAHPEAAVFALVDADMQNDPIVLPALVPYVGPYDAVIGVRDRAEMPRHRRMANSLANLPYRLLAGVAVSDVQSGLRLYSRTVVEWLVENLSDTGRYTLEHGTMLLFGALARRRGRDLCIAEVRVPCTYGGASSTIRMRDNVQLVRATIHHALALARLLS
jgi:glycosyltransferase involved in cell wall biosynthesis